MDRRNFTLEWGTDEGSAQSEFAFLHNWRGEDGQVVWKWPNNDDINIVDVITCFCWPKVHLSRAVRESSYLVFKEEKEVREKFLFVKDYGLHNALFTYSVKLPCCLEASLVIAVLIVHFNKRICIVFWRCFFCPRGGFFCPKSWVIKNRWFF